MLKRPMERLKRNSGLNKFGILQHIDTTRVGFKTEIDILISKVSNENKQ